MVSGKFADAEDLYRTAIAQKPNDEELTAGLVRVLLAEQKVDDAAAMVQTALGKDAQSAPLLTALALVQHRQGLPWEEEKTLQAAQANGLCYAPVHLALARYYRFNSYYASARRQIDVAHQLDPYDPAIWREWKGTLPRSQRIEEVKSYLAGHNGDTDEVRGAKAELAMLESEDGSNAACHLVADYVNRYSVCPDHV